MIPTLISVKTEQTLLPPDEETLPPMARSFINAVSCGCDRPGPLQDGPICIRLSFTILYDLI